jgi:hypothetical protein
MAGNQTSRPRSTGGTGIKEAKNEELLIAHMAGTRLHSEITQIPLWRAPGDENA